MHDLGQKHMDTLQELFQGTLRDVYYAEKQITKALPKLAKKATSEHLVDAFRTHLEQTHGRIERLEKVFELIGAPAKGKKCDAVHGIIKEAEGMMKKAKDPTVRDAAILAATQAAKHYEISRYGSLKVWAQKLGIPEAVQLLDKTLREEKDADEKLSELAESEINVEADNEKSEQDDQNKKTRKASAPRLKTSKGGTIQEPTSK
jgi:ferritin-like metal-binding protein YciE